METQPLLPKEHSERKRDLGLEGDKKLSDIYRYILETFTIQTSKIMCYCFCLVLAITKMLGQGCY